LSSAYHLPFINLTTVLLVVGLVVIKTTILNSELTSTAADAIKFRESLAKRALSPVTIKKAFATIKAVHNFVTKENGLDLSNSFSGVHIETAQYTSKKRLPINNEDINLIQGRCLEINDDLRLLIALISNTGMR